MTRTLAIVILVLWLAVALAACSSRFQEPLPGESPTSGASATPRGDALTRGALVTPSSKSLSSDDVATPPCTDCSCPNDCEPGPAPSCPSGTCSARGTCSCDPANAAADCPETGCCAAALDEAGQPALDPWGYPIYQCVTPACTSDADCTGGAVCEGAACGEARCVCPAGEGPDPEEPCCLVVNLDGVCCPSGEVDDNGMCVCTQPGMRDDGAGCACPDDMILDESGACVCADPHAVLDPDTGTCICASGFLRDTDPYTGESACVDHPDACPDPNEVIDPSTGECVCEPPLIRGLALETTTEQCVPPGCGDDVCSADETCASCSFDCGACAPGPDAGVGDGSDAGPPDAGVADGGTEPEPADAGAGDGNGGPLDARCVPGSGFARCR
jgi:hypothetical protein